MPYFADRLSTIEEYRGYASREEDGAEREAFVREVVREADGDGGLDWIV